MAEKIFGWPDSSRVHYELATAVPRFSPCHRLSNTETVAVGHRVVKKTREALRALSWVRFKPRSAFSHLLEIAKLLISYCRITFQDEAMETIP